VEALSPAANAVLLDPSFGVQAVREANAMAPVKDLIASGSVGWFSALNIRRRVLRWSMATIASVPSGPLMSASPLDSCLG